MSTRLTVSRAGHAYALDGSRIPSVTTITGKLDKPALKWWAAKEAATWAATHRDAVDVLGEDEWIKQATAAHNRTRKLKADHGTDVHAYTRAVTRGEAVDVPDDLADEVRQAVKFMDAWGVQEIAAERPCFNTAWRYGGTFDLLARMADGNTWLLDWKTGTGPYPEWSLQGVGYASCDTYQDDDGNDQPMPTVDRVGFVMLSPAGWDLVPVIAWDKPTERDRLFGIFTRLIGVNAFVEWSTPNSNGHAAWAVLGEPMPSPTVVAS